MARKILIDSSNTLGVWIQKQNAMSDYMGDLDDLRQDILDSADDELARYSGISFVTALNYVWDPKAQSITAFMDSDADIGDSSPLRANFLVDSGTFHKINANHIFAYDIEVRDSYDSGDLIGATGRDSGWYYFDSVDSTGKVFHYRPNKRLSLKIPSWDYDLHIESGGTFRNITVDSTTNFDSVDSAYFTTIHFRDDGITPDTFQDPTAWISSLVADSDAGTVTFGHLRLDYGIVYDSSIIGRISTPKWIADSAYIDLARVDDVFIESSFHIDSHEFRTVSPFLMTDSLGPDTVTDPGIIFFGAYKFDSNFAV